MVPYDKQTAMMHWAPAVFLILLLDSFSWAFLHAPATTSRRSSVCSRRRTKAASSNTDRGEYMVKCSKGSVDIFPSALLLLIISALTPPSSHFLCFANKRQSYRIVVPSRHRCKSKVQMRRPSQRTILKTSPCNDLLDYRAN